MKRKASKIVKTIAMIAVIILGVYFVFNSLDTPQRYETVTVEKAITMLNDADAVMEANGIYTIRTKETTVEVMPEDNYEFRQILFEKGLTVEEVDVSKTTSFDTALSFIFLSIVIIVLGNIIAALINAIGFAKGIDSTINKMPKEDKKDESSGPRGGFGFDMSSLNPANKMALNIKREIPNVKFENVAGINEVAREAQSIVSFLKNPYAYQKMGARMPKGGILYGPPGTGKTLIAKAIAGEADVPFLSVSGSDFMEMYVGVGAKRVRELFNEARKAAPCIVFIDEIDAVGGKRGRDNSSERDQTINAILTEMDGFVGSEGIFVLAATNRLDMLDNAILRPGRFDKHIAVSLPDKTAREAILNLHAKNKKLDETVDLKLIAAQTTGFAGADLENLLNEATIIAVEKKHNAVSSEDIDRAFFKVVMQGDVKDGQKNRDKKELELVAWHEAGHTLITKLLTNDEVTRVTILSSTSGAGGVTFHNPKEDEFFSKKDLRNRIAIAYGGRAAEEILFGDHERVTVGASSDIQSASKSIRDYIMKYGMSEKFGMLDISAFDYQSMSNDDIINEAAKLSNEIYDYTLNTLKNNKDTLEAIAKALLENESLIDKEIDAIINGDDILEETTVETVVETVE